MDTPGIVKFPAELDSPDSLIRVGNGLVTTLTADLAPGQLSIGVANASAWPATGIATIQKRVAATVGTETVYLPTGALEIINFERSGNTLAIQRGQQGTADIGHDAGDYIECRITAAHHETLSQALLVIEEKLGAGATEPTFGKVLRGDANGSSWQDRTFRHVQIAAANIWTINHNMACRPSVTVVDSAGTRIFGEIEYLNDNTVRVSFTAQFSGEAYLN